jgi:hypothetical protein
MSDTFSAPVMNAEDVVLFQKTALRIADALESIDANLRSSPPPAPTAGVADESAMPEPLPERGR